MIEESNNMNVINDNQANLLTREEEKEYVNAIKQGDEIAREKLIMANTGLVASIAKKYIGKARNLSMDDLKQEGYIGLIKAVNRFNPDKGFKLSTYATYWINLEIKRAIQNKDKNIRLTECQQQKVNQIYKIKDIFYKKYGREATDQEIANLVNISIDELRKIQEYLQTIDVYSLNARLHVDDDRDISLEEKIKYDGKHFEDSVLEEITLKEKLEYIYKTISPRDDYIPIESSIPVLTR